MTTVEPTGETEAFFDRPILNSPYERPIRHWELDESGQPTHKIIESRRQCSEFLEDLGRGRS